MYTITVTQKGQVVIPAGIRKRLHIKKGTKLLVREDAQNIIITPESADKISQMRGALRCEGSMTEFLLNERSSESEYMGRKWEK